MFSSTLSNIEINILGHKHYQNRSVKEKMFYSFFWCHDDSERDVAFDLMRYNDDSHFSDKWLYLAHRYASLPNNNCPLACEIRQLVRNKFQSDIQITKSVTTRTRYGDFFMLLDLDTSVVAREMETIINEQFQHMQHVYENL